MWWRIRRHRFQLSFGLRSLRVFAFAQPWLRLARVPPERGSLWRGPRRAFAWNPPSSVAGCGGRRCLRFALDRRRARPGRDREQHCLLAGSLQRRGGLASAPVAFLRGYHHVLFTLSLIDGSVVGQHDVDPPGSDPLVQQERGALALGSDRVYIPFGGLFGDCGNYHAYLGAVPVDGGAHIAYWSPVIGGAGIWSPSGPTIDSTGAVYVVTGNGSATQTFAYSNSVIQLSPDLQMRSFFAPSNWRSLDASDTDLGSVGATLLPSLGVVVAVGKEGVAYLLRAGQLGGVGGQIASRAVASRGRRRLHGSALRSSPRAPCGQSSRSRGGCTRSTSRRERCCIKRTLGRRVTSARPPPPKVSWLSRRAPRLRPTRSPAR